MLDAKCLFGGNCQTQVKYSGNLSYFIKLWFVLTINNWQ